MYLSLLHLDPSEASESADGEKKLNRVPDSILKAALLRRALEDIQRIVQLRSSKPALQTLQQRGSVGDELWQRLLRAEKEMEEEVKDVVNEVGRHSVATLISESESANRMRQANAFAPNWGQTIFQSANEMNQNVLLREQVVELQGKLEAEKSWWENKRAGIQSELMKELDEDEKTEKTTPRKTGSDDDAVLVEAGGPADQSGASGKKKGKKGGA